MSSVTKNIADKIIAQNGRYSTDPLCIAVIEYENIFDGGLTYKLVYQKDRCTAEQMQERIACRSSRIYWRRDK